MESKSAAVGAAQNSQVGENLAQALLQVNKLLYKTPPSLSIATTRRLVSAYPQQRVYDSSTTMVFSFPTGSQYIDMSNSFLKFHVQTSTALSEATFGKGSAANIIREVRVKSRSGTEISRLQGFNAYTAMADRWQCTKDDFATTKQAQGYGNCQLSATGLVNATPVGNGALLATGADYVLPLSLIPCFNPIGGVLMPPQLMDGCIIEIDLEDAKLAMLCTAGKIPSSYTVTVPEFRLCAFTLGDAFQRKIAQIAAKEGLSISFIEKYRTLVTSSNTAFQYDVKKAASQAVGVYILPRLSSVLASGDAAAVLDGFQSDVQHCNFMQANIGPVYYPNSPLSISSNSGVPTTWNSTELYKYVQQAWKPIGPGGRATGVPLSAFVAAQSTATGAAGVADALMGSLGFSFVRSTVSGTSGIMINSSRSCVLDVRFDNDGVSRRLDTWLAYVRNVKIFLSNQVVSD